MWILFLAFAGLLLASASSRLEAADTITALEITGNTTVGADAVRSHLKLSQGSAYDAAKADQSIKALFATGLFAHVAIDRRGTKVVVKVAENPIVARVYLEGNGAVDKAKL
ncbi:MAG TPA: POTRA domain-containing protein, partial [Hyphomicrobiaceae bacterium]|nr:POTRA domain-containing protein [Hyphomicrobiaceae bacterium]